MVLSLKLTEKPLSYKYIKAALGESRGGQFSALISPSVPLSIRLRESLAEREQKILCEASLILAPKNPANDIAGEVSKFNIQRALALED
jgi:hypothetical protein